jgi:hypothetical protein
LAPITCDAILAHRAANSTLTTTELTTTAARHWSKRVAALLAEQGDLSMSSCSSPAMFRDQCSR